MIIIKNYFFKNLYSLLYYIVYYIIYCLSSLPVEYLPNIFLSINKMEHLFKNILTICKIIFV